MTIDGSDDSAAPSTPRSEVNCDPRTMVGLSLIDTAHAMIQAISNTSDWNAIAVEFILHAAETALLASGSHTYNDPYCILQLSSGNQGYAFLHPDDTDLGAAASMVGIPVGTLSLGEVPPYLLAAFVDALAPHVVAIARPEAAYTLMGQGSKKSALRAELIVENTVRRNPSRIALIGGIEDLATRLAASGAAVRISDYYLAGTTLGNIEVEDQTEKLLAWCDMALVTGNILKTETLWSVCQALTCESKHAVLYSMTGHNYFAALAAHLPFATIFTEDFPFYWFANTPSNIREFRGATATRNPTV